MLRSALDPDIFFFLAKHCNSPFSQLQHSKSYENLWADCRSNEWSKFIYVNIWATSSIYPRQGHFSKHVWPALQLDLFRSIKRYKKEEYKTKWKEGLNSSQRIKVNKLRSKQRKNTFPTKYLPVIFHTVTLIYMKTQYHLSFF